MITVIINIIWKTLTSALFHKKNFKQSQVLSITKLQEQEEPILQGVQLKSIPFFKILPKKRMLT